MPSVRVTRILEEVLAGPTPAGSLPHRLVTLCARTLAVTGVGLTLVTDAGPAGSVATSDGPASLLEGLQFELGEGPCLECSTSGRPVLQPDLARTGPLRWPAFAAGALDAGVRAVFAFPLRVGTIRLGVLDLYRDRAGELSDADLTEALSFADAATELLLHLQDQQSLDGHGAVTVIEDRAEVHQATGMIAVRTGVPMAEALVRLRARAYALDRPLLDLSRDVLEGAISFTDEYDAGEEGR